MDADTFIGVDVSKNWLDFAVKTRRNSNLLKFRFDNNVKGFKELIKILRANNITIGKKVLVTLEHSRNYGSVFTGFMSKKKCMICNESALRIKKSMGIERGKNDSLDAERILDYSIKNKEKLNLWKEPRKVSAILQSSCSSFSDMSRLDQSAI